MGSANTIRRHSLVRLCENLQMLVGERDDTETGLRRDLLFRFPLERKQECHPDRRCDSKVERCVHLCHGRVTKG